MTTERESGQRAGATTMAIVLVVTDSQLFVEGLAGLLDGIAVVHHFPPGTVDFSGLARHSRADALVVDGPDYDDELCAVAGELSIPLIRFLSSPSTFQTFYEGQWHAASPEVLTPTVIRNHFVGVLYRSRPMTTGSSRDAQFSTPRLPEGVA